MHIKQYVKLFKMDKINLQFTPGALDYIVEKALQFKLGQEAYDLYVRQY